jgi:hypothetical protein
MMASFPAGVAARMVRDALREAGYANAYDVPVAAWVCCEPIVVSCGEWARESRQADGTERGTRKLVAHVCCDDPGDAEATARAVAADLAAWDWAAAETPAGTRIVACDVGRPVPYGRDRSGRWVWDVPMTMTGVVGNG